MPDHRVRSVCVIFPCAVKASNQRSPTQHVDLLRDNAADNLPHQPRTIADAWGDADAFDWLLSLPLCAFIAAVVLWATVRDPLTSVVEDVQMACRNNEPNTIDAFQSMHVIDVVAVVVLRS